MKNNRKSTENGQQGFTLVEIMVVVGILGIMTAILVPNIIQWRPNQQWKQSGRDLLSTMQKAKLEAVRRNATVVVALTPVACMGAPVTNVPFPGGSYRMFVDDGGGVAGNANNFIEDAGETWIQTVNIRANVALCTNYNGNATSFLGNLQTGFTSQGLPAGGRNGTALIVNNQDNAYTLTISTAGVIRLQ